MAEERTEKKKSMGGWINKDAANFTISIFDRQMANFLERMVAGIPEGHWLRSPATDQLAGPLKSVIESWTGRGGFILAVCGEKCTDYIDLVRRSLTSGDGGGRAPSAGAGSGKRKKWREWAEKRIEESESPEAEMSNIEARFRAWTNLDKLLDEQEQVARPEQPEKRTEPIHLGPKLKSIKEKSIKKTWGTEGEPGPLRQFDERAADSVKRLRRSRRSRERRLTELQERRMR